MQWSRALRLQDVGLSLRIVWAAISLAILAILATPFLVSGERLALVVPVCEWKAKYGRECPACGMTTSFLDISKGRLRDASRANHAGIPLYGIFILNEICALALLRRQGANSCKH